jgi:hypothetical protein
MVDYVRLDNARENKLLKQRCHSEDWKFDTEFEFTARAAPQQNALAELGFATLVNRGRNDVCSKCTQNNQVQGLR